MMRSLILIVGASACFFCGLLVSMQNERLAKGQYAQIRRSSRDPAAIRKVYDFSNLEGSALFHASKNRIVSGYEVHHDESLLGVSLGNFVVKGDSGQKEFSCRKFQTVTLSYESEGVAVAGEKPKMEVEGGCEVSSDINKIMPLWLPLGKILGQPVGDGEFDFWQESRIKVRFSNVSDQWPQDWVLTKIRLSNDRNEEIVVETSELQELLDRPARLKLTL